jgi:hypothetical protein
MPSVRVQYLSSTAAAFRVRYILSIFRESCAQCKVAQLVCACCMCFVNANTDATLATLLPIGQRSVPYSYIAVQPSVQHCVSV